MNLEQILQALEQNGDPRAINIWKKFGMDSSVRYLGNNLGALKTLAKTIKRNHNLALQLWDCGVHDAKLLATYIEEPKKVTEAQIDAQLADIYFMDICNKWVEGMVMHTPFAKQKMELWTQAEAEYTKRAGFVLLMGLAKNEKTLADDYFIPYINQIEKQLQTERNWVKEMMNYALLVIGKRNKNLHALALKAAEIIGDVEVDYGDSSCQTTNTYAMLSKVKF